jgi:TRAP-type C4-dicarboxylate transport system substrate-binding protein
MKHSTKNTLLSMAVAAGMAFSAGGALAEPVELIYDVFIPHHIPIAKDGLIAWADDVETASNGTLEITVPSSGVAPVPQLWDAVEDGLVDIALVVNTFRSKQIQLPTILTLPLVDGNAEAVSRAWWETYEADFMTADEYGPFLALSGFTTNGPHLMATKKTVTKPEDFQGLKVRVEGSEQIQIFENLGATPVGNPGLNSFELLTGGVVDAGLSPFGPAIAQGQLGVTNVITTFPGGFARSGFTIVMLKERFESLPEDAKEALLSTSGAELAAKLGAIVDMEEVDGRKKFEEDGASITAASAEMVDFVRQASGFLRQQWIDRANAKGLDGEAVLGRYLDRVKAGK